MSDPNDSALTGSIGDDGRASLSSTFLDFCCKVRTNDTSILQLPGQLLQILSLSEKEEIELADALLENTNIAYLQLDTKTSAKRSAEAMAKYLRTSKALQRIL
jgi:hypothetical protein